MKLSMGTMISRALMVDISTAERAKKKHRVHILQESHWVDGLIDE